MIRARLRSNAAAALRSLAKWLGARAESLEPVKISRPSDTRSALLLTHPRVIAQRCVEHGVIQQQEVPAFLRHLASKDRAKQAIEKARS